MDADEELSPELRSALAEWKEKEPEFAAYEFARRTWYLGAWVWHTRWYPDYQLKLYRRDKSRFEVPEHATVKYNGPVGRLEGDLLHYTLHSFEEHAAKVESITTRQAHWNWFNNYILCRGFLDGYRGWVISRMAARGTWLKFKKLGALIEAERRAGGIRTS